MRSLTTSKKKIFILQKHLTDKMRVVFFGTPAFAADILTFLIEKQIDVQAVISRPDKPQGRSGHPVRGAVRNVAEANKIPHFQPEKVSAGDFLPVLQRFQADFFVVAAYGEIISQKVLDLPKIACINVHASLLPKYRGAAPIQRAIIDGEKESGITIMHMVRKMDAGAIILQKTMKIDENETYGGLEFAMRKEGAEALLEALCLLKKGKARQCEQNDLEVTYAPKIELEDCAINWDDPAVKIHNLVRGVNPEPSAWCMIRIGDENKRLKVYSTRVCGQSTLSSRECVFAGAGKVLVGTGSGACELLEVQLEGKKRMAAAEFFRGIQNRKWEII